MFTTLPDLIIVESARRLISQTPRKRRHPVIQMIVIKPYQWLGSLTTGSNVIEGEPTEGDADSTINRAGELATGDRNGVIGITAVESPLDVNRETRSIPVRPMSHATAAEGRTNFARPTNQIE